MPIENKKKIHWKIKDTSKMKGRIPWNKGKKMSQEFRDKMRQINLGKKPSEETLKKRSMAMMGKRLSEETKLKISKANKGKIGNNLGKKFSEETKLKMSLASKGKLKPNMSGEKHHQWKGGVTPINHSIRNNIYYKFWRKSCFERDNFTDQKTGISGGLLQVHHINNFADFPELRFAIDNGITLSKKSHQDFHKIYGFKNNTREQLEEFLQNDR